MIDLLKKINGPNDIKKLPISSYPRLASEIREFLIDSVSKTGGHLASNLGTVELTIALHAVLNLPKDKIVWDVGHQAYTHKILTGRKNLFENLRQLDGLSGFPKAVESDCDSFDTGHSSTSISAALGMATAMKIKNDDSKVVAVIGDGALTGGMALEALNNVSALLRDMIIILNDNEMSISKNVGGMSKYLNQIRLGERYNELKHDVEKSLNSIPRIGDGMVKKVKHTKDKFKNLFIKSSFFDDLGVTYVGPVDGHDINELITLLKRSVKLDHPVLIHIKTVKGKGYRFAQENPSKFHGIAKFDKASGEVLNKTNLLSYTDVFSKHILNLAKDDDRIVAITAAMPDGTGLTPFAEKYPSRFFDVGIAEEHAVTFAAGLAKEGLKPFVSIYSSFYQRAYDQILHDVCLQNLGVVLMCDRAGLVGCDGETHQGIFDISFITSMPNITVIAPKDVYELKAAMNYAKDCDGPVFIRYSRGTAIAEGNENKYDITKGDIITKGRDVAIISIGNIYSEVKVAAEKLNKDGIKPTVVNPIFLKPLNTKLIEEIANDHTLIVIVEEAIKNGGFGEQVEVFIKENNIDCKVKVLAIDDKFVEHGEVPQLRKRLGIDGIGIYNAVKDNLD